MAPQNIYSNFFLTIDNEINKLKNAGADIHKLKKQGGKSCGEVDLYKDNKGEIFTKPKNGSGPGEPTGYNINNL